MRKVITALSAGALALTAGLVGAPSASAAFNDGACQHAENCLFGKYDYKGGMADIDPTDSNWTNNWLGNGNNVNDRISSGFAINRAVRYYQHAGFGGYNFILGLNQYDAHWTTNQPNASSSAYNFDNQVSSSHVYIP